MQPVRFAVVLLSAPPPATRIIAGWYLLHQDADDFPATTFDAFDPANEATNAHVDVQVCMRLSRAFPVADG